MMGVLLMVKLNCWRVGGENWLGQKLDVEIVLRWRK